MRAIVSVLLLFASAWALQGGSIQYVGEQLSMGAGWRTPSTPKTHDIDGDNIYGTLGWAMFATHPPGSIGGSADIFNNAESSANVDLGSSGSNFIRVEWLFPTPYSWGGAPQSYSYTAPYTAINNPAGGADIWSGIAYCNGCVATNWYDLFRITFLEGAPSTIRIGEFNNGSVSPVARRMTGMVGGVAVDSGIQSPATHNYPYDTYTNDYYFFDVTGIQAGDYVVVAGKAQTAPDGSGPVGFSGFTFDTPGTPPDVPEPGTLLLVGGALLAVGATRRRRAL